MTAYEFLAPRQLISGEGSSRSIGAALRSWGVQAGGVAVVVDSAVGEAGLIGPALDGLVDAGFTPSVFAGIESEPDIGSVQAALAFSRLGAPVAVVGIGGGSALDTAKLVALLLSNDVDLAAASGPIEPEFPVLPLALVPTTTGTGSEVTRIAMLSIEGTKRIVSCPQLVPIVAVLDDSFVVSLPGSVAAATAMDAIAHAVESVLSLSRSPLSIQFAFQAAELLLENIEAGVLSIATQARSRLLLGAYEAGLALNAGVVVGHSIGYVVAERAGLSHGASCSLALPYCIAYSTTALESRAGDSTLAELSRIVTSGDSSNPHDAALVLDNLGRHLGLPTSLEAVGIAEAELDDLAVEIVDRYPRPNSPTPLQASRLRLLLTCMYSGDVEAAYSLMLEHARV